MFVRRIKEWKKATFDISQTINYVQLTSQTILFKCHRRILLCKCSHPEATVLHIQEAAYSLNTPFSVFLTVHSSLFCSLNSIPDSPVFPLCFPCVTITVCCSIACHFTAPAIPPPSHLTHQTEKSLLAMEKAFDINTPIIALMHCLSLPTWVSVKCLKPILIVIIHTIRIT